MVLNVLGIEYRSQLVVDSVIDLKQLAQASVYMIDTGQKVLHHLVEVRVGGQQRGYGGGRGLIGKGGPGGG